MDNNVLLEAIKEAGKLSSEHIKDLCRIADKYNIDRNELIGNHLHALEITSLITDYNEFKFNEED